MIKKNSVDINSVDDALERLNNPKDGDQVIVRAMPLTVPSPSYDLAITNASMQLFIDNFTNDPDSISKYNLQLCPQGRYEVVAVFHMRKIEDLEQFFLN